MLHEMLNKQGRQRKELQHGRKQKAPAAYSESAMIAFQFQSESQKALAEIRTIPSVCPLAPDFWDK